jgi:hypothetical protein
MSPAYYRPSYLSHGDNPPAVKVVTLAAARCALARGSP